MRDIAIYFVVMVCAKIAIAPIKMALDAKTARREFSPALMTLGAITALVWITGLIGMILAIVREFIL